MAEKTREQRMAEVKERLENFSNRTVRMYEFVYELIDIVKSFNGECEELKSSDLCKATKDKMFDKAYKMMVDSITDKFREEKVDLAGVNILQNILYKDDRVDGKMMCLMLTAWCQVSGDSYPAASLYILLQIYRILSE